MTKEKKMTTASGIPVADNQNSLTAGEKGPVLLQDFHLLEKLAHFNRERIPERVVHAKGAGAFGTLTITHDITKYTKAKMFSKVGKKTDLFVRFFSGLVNIFCGGPDSIILPFSINIISSATCLAKPISCVTTNIVTLPA